MLAQNQLIWFINMFSKSIGVSEDLRGLLFAEASDGNLQTYIDQHNDTIDVSL
jgi:hypothetical protein